MPSNSGNLRGYLGLSCQPWKLTTLRAYLHPHCLIYVLGGGGGVGSAAAVTMSQRVTVTGETGKLCASTTWLGTNGRGHSMWRSSERDRTGSPTAQEPPAPARRDIVASGFKSAGQRD
ncbi:Peroxisomal (S)-2-hydroxy-acid oxidase GLO5 [Fusarium oxysporum f. sp. albedinis]|nr:Peroxisomal (S)-2-hydroxy-acid oxidase GLO5 [Fusarium oxysporum f. sp. albedinis]